MNLKELLRDDTAVSPVIGVILMVAITVILAAVIGTFVLGLGDQVGDTSPQASFSFDYDNGADTLTVVHDGGDGIDPANLHINVQGGSTTQWSGGAGSKVTAGSSETVSPVSSSDTVRVVWQSPNGDTTSTLGEWNGPDA